MLNPSFLRASVWFLLLLYPPAAMGTEVNAALVQPQGNVYLNGGAFAHATAVFLGDQVQTAERASATFMVKGSTLLLAADSLLRYRGNVVELQRGSVLITTTRGMSARTAGLTITPVVGGSARFLVVYTQGRVQITALENNLAIDDGRAKALLEQGQTTRLEAGGNALPHFKASLTGGEIAALIFGIGAAVGAGVAVGLTKDESPSSP